MTRESRDKRGFTLIEMSIVLVIIGLIVGGVLVGRDLIKASVIRSQLSQISRYNIAVNAFRDKYGGLPGDLQVAIANQAGFITTGCDGRLSWRDGDGNIIGVPLWIIGNINETIMFWEDLSQSGIIEGKFPGQGAPAIGCTSSATAWNTSPGSTYLGNYFPEAKIGGGNFVYIINDGVGHNWFTLSQITATDVFAHVFSGTDIAVSDAAAMDAKIDDGVAATGKVQAIYGANGSPDAPTWAPNVATAGGSSSSCFDTTTNRYSVTFSGGNNLNCALSFQFQ